MTDLLPRVLSAIVMIILALGALWLGGSWFVFFWLVASAAVFWEWLGLIGSQRRQQSAGAGAAIMAVAAGLTVNGLADIAIILCIAGACVLAFLERRTMPVWAAAGMIYASALLISVCALRMSLVFGFETLLWLFAVVWGTDIFAYFGGRSIGGAKLWPRVSPSKTWSGFLTGVTGGAIAGAIVLMLRLPDSRQSLVLFLVLGVLTGAVSQAGDLLESSIKRRFGVKDSSQLIPGHGGFMDRLDGFITATAFVALLGMLRAGTINPAAGIWVW